MIKTTSCNCFNCTDIVKKSEYFEGESSVSNSPHSPFTYADRYVTTNSERGMYVKYPKSIFQFSHNNILSLNAVGFSNIQSSNKLNNSNVKYIRINAYRLKLKKNTMYYYVEMIV